MAPVRLVRRILRLSLLNRPDHRLDHKPMRDQAVMTDAMVPAHVDDSTALTAIKATNNYYYNDADDASIDTDNSYGPDQPEDDESLQEYLHGPRPAFDYFGFPVEALFLTLDGSADSFEFHRHHDPYRVFEPRPCPLVSIIPHADVDMHVS
ncbi:hypothetical protein Pmar_PMAR012301 [Perkinsus marinus ATCC 50983]|uniref:Uncharacterized protein n=1 Tax=Perkinsus marinus (strain ATCC 50983 / TXsc) TaxID=423536 RepID=C5KV37_PERM5|nr:hypothetical protein Pmar_PMAR012301 [Perkinsus marinus ATCC 50983]EER11656.1 hypothetical protein Pmar_PMAR012301 [Perkinsus marinus ATCC 50983]|eukprot:XP_002779861.1 hypothetical protein Pmar_PMAR012301 [Perkinsus marinus ATCC 50983]